MPVLKCSTSAATTRKTKAVSMVIISMRPKESLIAVQSEGAKFPFEKSTINLRSNALS